MHRNPESQDYTVQSYVAATLAKCCLLFFNFTLFHAAGQNDTADIKRSADLSQISSVFGTLMESVDALKLVERAWDAMSSTYEMHELSAELESFISVTAEGHPFSGQS